MPLLMNRRSDGENENLPWNCFDVAIGIEDILNVEASNPVDKNQVRAELVRRALEHSSEPAYRDLLAPEIRHTAALLSSADTNTGDQASDMYLLPASMRTELKNLFNNYDNALNDEQMKTTVDYCNNALNKPEGQRLSLDELRKFFQVANNRQDHQNAYQLFNQKYQDIVKPAEEAFAEYCSLESTYSEYIQKYYGQQGWFAFQRGLAEEQSTSMVDVTAKLLKLKITIYDPNQCEIYYTTKLDDYDREIFISYKGVNNFIKIKTPHPIGIEKNIVLPFTNKLPVDTNLNLLKRKNFKQSLEQLVKKGTKPTEQLKAVPPYPTPYVLAQFASKVYTDYKNNEYMRDYENRLMLPQGWRLLTTAANTNTNNGYFGAAYWHPEHQQVVIAHRGTKLNKFGPAWTDFLGIVFNNYMAQMISASTFADTVSSVLSELNKQPGINFQLFFTGHSLGGWLAQITNFTNEYLEKKTESGKDYLIFRTINQDEDFSDNYHAHTVVFDSPGCEKMLLEMQKEFDLRNSGRNICLDLDITSYLSAPNLINTRNFHIGTVYRIFIDKNIYPNLVEISCGHCINPLNWYSMLSKLKEYNKKTHKMDNILTAFDPAEGQFRKESNQLTVLEVEDWPISRLFSSTKEYWDFLRWASKLNQFNPNLKNIEANFKEKKIVTDSGSHYAIRYHTKAFDEQAVSMRVFTHAERLFLNKYLLFLNEYPEFFKPEELFNTINDDDTKNNAQNNLKNFYIKNNIIGLKNTECNPENSPPKLQEFIPYIKRLLQLFPKIKAEIKEVSSKFWIKKRYYQKETTNYLKVITQSSLDFKYKVNSDLEQFLQGQQKIWQLHVDENTQIGLTKIYKVFQNIKKHNTNYDSYTYTVMKLKRLLEVNKDIFNLKEFLTSQEMSYHLLIVEYKIKEEYKQEAQTLFAELFTVLQDKSNIKIIVITHKDTDLSEIVQRKATETLDNNQYLKTEDKGFTWDDLRPESHKTLLAKKVTLQGQAVVLRELLGVDDTAKLSESLNRHLNTLLDEKVIIQLSSSTEDNPIVIGHEPLRLSDLEAAYAKHYEAIEPQNLVKALVNAVSDQNSKVLFMISGFDSETPEDEQLVRQLEITGTEIKNHFVLLGKDIGNKKIIVVTGHDNEQHLKNFEQLCSDNPRKTIYWVSLTHHEVIWQHLYDPNFYVDRKLKKVAVKETVKARLVQPGSTDLLVFSGLSKASLYEWLGVTKEEVQQPIFLKEGTESEFKQKIEDNPTKLVHWLKSEGKGNHQQLVWKRSHDPSITQNSQPAANIKESEFSLVSDDKLVVIVDEPGMGKSTILTRLTEESISSSWVIRLNLKDCQKALEQKKEEANFLWEAAGGHSDDTLAIGLLSYHLKSTTSRPLLVLLDGFDEINNDDHQKIVIQLLKFLKNKPTTKVWVTTRLHQQLENHLEVLFTTELEPFDEKQQTEFLRKFWQVRSQLLFNQDNSNQIFGTINDKETKFSQYADALIKKAEILLKGDKKKFIGIPLQMRLLAETFQKKFEKFVKSIDSLPESYLDEFNNVIVIYQYFIEARYEIFFNEKTRLSKELSKVTKGWMNEALTKRHRRFGFHEIFSEETTALALLEVKSPFLDEENRLNNDQMQELYRIGLVQPTKGKSPFGFIHRTFAECFTADVLSRWLTISPKHYKNPQRQNLLLTSILINPKYQIVRTFFDGQLAKNPPPLSTLTEYGNCIAELWLDRDNPLRKKYGETFLHIAGEEGNATIISVLLDSLKQHPDTLKAMVEATNYGQTALHRAAEKGTADSVKALLDSVKSYPKTLETLVMAKNMYGRTALHLAAEKDTADSVQALLDSVKSYLKTLKYLVIAKDRYDHTALHIAAKKRTANSVQALLDSVKSYQKTLEDMVMAKDRNDYTALHVAAMKGTADSVQMLLDSVKSFPKTLEDMVMAKNMYGRTALHLAAEKDTADSVQALLDPVKSYQKTLEDMVMAKDRYDHTALHVAAMKGTADSVRSLLDSVKSYTKTLEDMVMAKDRNDYTALHVAAMKGTADSVQPLLIFLKKIFEETLMKYMYGFHLAAEKGTADSVQALLDSVKSYPKILEDLVMKKNKLGQTALHMAAMKGTANSVQALLDSVNSHPKTLEDMVMAKDRNDYTALHLAARENSWDIAVTLLKAGANIKDLNVKQLNLLKNYVQDKGYIELLDALEVSIRDIGLELLGSGTQQLNHRMDVNSKRFFIHTFSIPFNK